MTNTEFIIVLVVVMFLYRGYVVFLQYKKQTKFPPRVHLITTQQFWDKYGKENIENFNKYGGCLCVDDANDLRGIIAIATGGKKAKIRLTERSEAGASEREEKVDDEYSTLFYKILLYKRGGSTENYKQLWVKGYIHGKFKDCYLFEIVDFTQDNIPEKSKTLSDILQVEDFKECKERILNCLRLPEAAALHSSRRFYLIPDIHAKHLEVIQ